MLPATQAATIGRPAPGVRSGITLREMRASDIAPVAAIERRVKFDAWRARDFRRCLDAGSVCRVAEVAHEPIGYGVMSLAARYARIDNLCIASGCQRRGHGRMLLVSLLREAQARGVPLVFLEVRAGHARARALYRGVGFREAGRRHGYYQTRTGWEDAVIMARYVATDHKASRK